MGEIRWHPRSTPLERMLELRRKGKTAEEIAGKVGRDPTTVNSVLREAGLDRFDRGGNREQRIRDRQLVRDLDAQGASERQIARELGGRSRTYVKQLRRENGSEPSQPTTHLSGRDREVVRLYTVDGLSQKAIAAHLGDISHSRVSQILRGLGYTAKDRGAHSGTSSYSDRDLKDLYLVDNLGLKAISERTGIPKTTVRGRLVRMGVTLRQPAHTLTRQGRGAKPSRGGSGPRTGGQPTP